LDKLDKKIDEISIQNEKKAEFDDFWLKNNY